VSHSRHALPVSKCQSQLLHQRTHRRLLLRVDKEQPFCIESTPGKIAFLARFSDLYNTINRTYGIRVDYRTNCISAPRAPVDELERLSQENSMLREMPVDELIELDDYDCIEELFNEELRSQSQM
jgi:hypothetical protein